VRPAARQPVTGKEDHHDSHINDHRVESTGFVKIETYSPRNVLHAFRLRAPGDVDAEFIVWLTQAYRVGEQRHLLR